MEEIASVTSPRIQVKITGTILKPHRLEAALCRLQCINSKPTAKAISKSKDSVQANEFIHLLLAFKLRGPSAHTAVCVKILSSVY